MVHVNSGQLTVDIY